MDSSVDAMVNYYLPPEGSKGPELNDIGLVLSAKDMTTHPMRINDIRGHEDEFSLEKNGFTVGELNTKVTDFNDESAIKSTYYREIEELIKRTTGASRVLVYHHAVRNKSANEVGSHMTGYQGQEGPAKRIHIDQTPEGAYGVLSFMFPEEAEQIAKNPGGYQLINVWRPLSTVRRDPLMVANMAKMPKDDLVSLPREYHNGMKTANYIVKYEGKSAESPDDGVVDGKSSGGEHEWWYIGGQEASEALIFLSANLRDGKLAPGTVHGSFSLPDQDGIPPRHSIETRVVAVY